MAATREKMIQDRADIQYKKEETKAKREVKKDLYVGRFLAKRVAKIIEYYNTYADKRDERRIQMINSVKKELDIREAIAKLNDEITERRTVKNDLLREQRETINEEDRIRLEKDIRNVKRQMDARKIKKFFKKVDIFNKRNWADIVELKERKLDNQARAAHTLLSKMHKLPVDGLPSLTEELEEWSKAMDTHYAEALKSKNPEEFDFVKQGLEVLKAYRANYTKQKGLETHIEQKEKEIEDLEMRLKNLPNVYQELKDKSGNNPKYDEIYDETHVEMERKFEKSKKVLEKQKGNLQRELAELQGKALELLKVEDLNERPPLENDGINTIARDDNMSQISVDIEEGRPSRLPAKERTKDKGKETEERDRFSSKYFVLESKWGSMQDGLKDAIPSTSKGVEDLFEEIRNLNIENTDEENTDEENTDEENKYTNVYSKAYRRRSIESKDLPPLPKGVRDSQDGWKENVDNPSVKVKKKLDQLVNTLMAEIGSGLKSAKEETISGAIRIINEASEGDNDQNFKSFLAEIKHLKELELNTKVASDTAAIKAIKEKYQPLIEALESKLQPAASLDGRPAGDATESTKDDTIVDSKPNRRPLPVPPANRTKMENTAALPAELTESSLVGEGVSDVPGLTGILDGLEKRAKEHIISEKHFVEINNAIAKFGTDVASLQKSASDFEKQQDLQILYQRGEQIWHQWQVKYTLEKITEEVSDDSQSAEEDTISKATEFVQKLPRDDNVLNFTEILNTVNSLKQQELSTKVISDTEAIKAIDAKYQPLMKALEDRGGVLGEELRVSMEEED